MSYRQRAIARDGGLMAVDRFKLVDKIQWVQDNLDSLSSAMCDLYLQAERSIFDAPDDGQTVNVNIYDRRLANLRPPRAHIYVLWTTVFASPSRTVVGNRL
jgi:hypothetical protein